MEDPAKSSRSFTIAIFSALVVLAILRGCSSHDPAKPSGPLAEIQGVPAVEAAPAEPAIVPTAEPSEPVKPLPIPPKPLPVPPAVEPSVAIRIGTVAKSEAIRITHGSGRLLISLQRADAGELPWSATTPIEIRAVKGGWQVTSSAQRTRAFSPGELAVRCADEGRCAIEWNARAWPGQLRLVLDDQEIDIVMDVPMESYLPGVIAKELYGSWCEAAFEAQAIAARSYAVVEEARWEGRRHYDMVAGQQSQAWIGATDNVKAIQAVRNTRGELLVHDGSVVPTYYSSACGGRPASAFGVLTDNPFHDIAPVAAGEGSPRAVCCQSTAVATWKVSIPLAVIQVRLERWATANGRPDIAGLQVPSAIEAVDKNATGRPTLLRIRDRKGQSATIAAEDFRRAINAASDAKTNMRSSDCSIRISGSAADISGRGFGHGVGLCQHGAQEMGRKGKSCQQILARYYPSAMIVKAWR
ncbi:MAG: SpoIID/LytB domain-containing protein [Phycisphaerales bacterium]|nr:SpoIID/LytB domain-containing protein [Phycisphaerales bacterium]